MTRKPAPSTKPAPGPERHVPSCPRCEFTGRPTAEATPYVYCGGDIRRHGRKPVVEQYRVEPVAT